MLTESYVCMVRELLAEGLSQRAVARETGVSRASVGRVARGELPAEGHRRRAPREKVATLAQAGPPIRCPDCGHLVYPPCRMCRLRKKLAAGALDQVFRDVGLEQPLELELQPEHQERYEEVRAQRMQQERRHRPR